ncbi:cilia- and flagella-associated protein 43-like isoform X2 [Neocloeon triangulifer]|nr:cilia- and flagella-associated protein 43-like isoform X2 [Neocloeon triangulifer]
MSKFRLKVCTAVTQEELKVARIKLWILTQSVLLSNETRTREELRVCSEEVEALSTKRQTLQTRCERKRRKHERLKAHDKKQDKTFHQHFTHSSPPAVVQQLSKLYKRRPAINLSASQLRLLNKDYLRPANNADQPPQVEEQKESEDESEEETPLHEPCKLFMAALKIIDVTGKRPSVDTTAWRALCKMRRAKVEAEIRVKATALEVSEVEQTLAEVDANLTFERNREQRLREKLNAILDRKRRLLLDIELQILLPLGQIEVKNLHDPKEIEESILVPRKLVRQQNNRIRDAGAAKMVALERSVRFREGQLQVAHWYLQKVTLQLQIAKDELKYVEKLPITSEMKKYLKGTLQAPSRAKVGCYEKDLVRRRREALASRLADLQGQQKRLKYDNLDLERQIAEAKRKLEGQKAIKVEPNPLIASTKLAGEKSKLERKFREQEIELLGLKEELEKMKLRTFPTLFNVSV